MAFASLLVTLGCAARLRPAPRVEATAQAAKLPSVGPTAPGGANRCDRAIADRPLESPEAVVHLYVESVAANDLACALRAYAAHEYAAAFDFTALVSGLQGLNPGVLKAPAAYPMFVGMNELRAEGEMADATKAFVYGLLTDVDFKGVERMDPARLAKLKVVRVDQPSQSDTTGIDAPAMLKARATRDGADEIVHRIALYELSDQFFWSAFELRRYDKTWKIYELRSSYGPGIPRKTTPAEYEARLR